MLTKTKGTLCLVASAFGFAAMGMFIRLADDLGGPVSCFQKAFFRNLVAVFVAGAMFVRGTSGSAAVFARPQARDWILLLARSVLGTAGIFLNFYAISHIPLADALMLNKLAPFFSVLFCWLFMGERLHLAQGVCLLLALLGAALVVKPGGEWTVLFPAVCGFFSGMFAGSAYACVHALGRRRVDSRLVVLFFSLFSTLASVPFIAFDFAPMTLCQVASLVGAGVMATVGQFGVTAAYRFAEPREIAAWDYTNVLFAAAFGFIIFNQVPDIWSGMGFLLILLAAFQLRRVGAR